MIKFLLPSNLNSECIKELDYLNWITENTNVRIEILHVWENDSKTEFVLNRSDLNNIRISDYLNNEKADLISLVLTKYDSVKSIHFKSGHLEDEILKISNANDFHYLVSNTHGLNSIKDFFYGNTTQNLLHNSNIPVLSVGKDIKISERRNVVFIHDFAESEELDFTRLKAFMKQFNFDIEFLKVNTDSEEDPDNSIVRMKDFARKYNFYTERFTIQAAFDLEGGIQDFKNENRTCLFAIGTHARKGIDHFFHGSKAEDLVSNIESPVLVFNMLE